VSDRGSISPVVAAMLGVLVLVGCWTADLARVAVAASAAPADAAALAAAQAIAMPTGAAPEVAAATFASVNGAVLVECRCDPATFQADVTVVINVDDLVLSSARRIVRSARAVVDLPTSSS
jgi:hypothetical protein